MPISPLSVVIQHVLPNCGPDVDGVTDGELLTHFLSRRDDDALAALVRRHAPMVWGACCRLLHNHHDAEDAFQATFLVLVRKAVDVPSHAVANWLYGVARQTAVRLRATAAKQARRETQMMNMPESTAAEVRDADLKTVLDEELSRLPNHYRSAIVMCDLEGMTRREAARQLGIPEGSVASRLARARVMLAKRLTRRGVAFSGGSVATALSVGSAASAPPALVTSTIRAASLLAAGPAAGAVSAKVAALTEGVVKAMLMTTIKGALAVVLVVGLALAGTAILIDQTQAGQPKAKEPAVNVDKHDGKVEKSKDAGQQAAQPKQQPAKSDRERMVGGWVIINDDSKRKGEVWEISTDEIVMNANLGGFRVDRHFHRLDATKNPKEIDITVTKTNREHIGVIKGIYTLGGGELRLCLGVMDKDRPAAFPAEPKPGEVLILRGDSGPKADDGALKEAEKLRALIDKVLAAHGGEDKLSKLKCFTETVKQDNGTTVEYFVQPPDHYRAEYQQKGETTKQIHILLQNGMMRWTKHPNGEAEPHKPGLGGFEPATGYYLDNVKFFGPRQVLRLKDAAHQVSLLDEEIKIDGRAAVGVELTYAIPKIKFKPSRRMYFDKETHLLVKQEGSVLPSPWPIYYSDYKKFDGIPIAQKEKHSGMEIEVTDFRAVDKFDAKLFEKP